MHIILFLCLLIDTWFSPTFWLIEWYYYEHGYIKISSRNQKYGPAAGALKDSESWVPPRSYKSVLHQHCWTQFWWPPKAAGPKQHWMCCHMYSLFKNPVFNSLGDNSTGRIVGFGEFSLFQEPQFSCAILYFHQ